MIAPMLASKADAIPNSGRWIAEPKCDGWRCLARVDDLGDLVLSARSGAMINTVPYIEKALSSLPSGTILDGEILDLSPGRAQWNRAQSILSRKSAHVPDPSDPPLSFVLFDVLELEGMNIMNEPLRSRRQILKLLCQLLENAGAGEMVRITTEMSCAEPLLDDWFDELVARGYEGVVAKKLDSAYIPGARNGSWIKVKSEVECDVEVTGVYPPEPGSRYHGIAVGGITFTVTHEDGTSYAGRCAGMDDALREELFSNPSNFTGRVAVVEHAGISKDGALRFPRFKRFRDPADKSVKQLTALLPSNTSANILLKRAVEAEERAQIAEEKVAELQSQLRAAVKVATKPTRAGSGGSRGRNYDAMHSAKLIAAVESLRCSSGEAYEWVVKRNREVGEELHRAEAVARARGLI